MHVRTNVHTEDKEINIKFLIFSYFMAKNCFDTIGVKMLIEKYNYKKCLVILVK